MAVELVASALLSSSLNFLFDRIGSGEILAYLRGKSKKSCDFDALVGELRSVLNSVLAVIEDAEKKQRKSKSVEMWLDNLQDVVFDAEDLLDDIEYAAMRENLKEESRGDTSKPRNSLKKKLRNVFKKKWRRHEEEDMESKVKTVLEKFEKIASQKDPLGLEMSVFMERASWRLPSTCLMDESEVFGRDCDKHEVIKLLLADDLGNEKLGVISIVGMGGLGKTTLAQSIFNERKVTEHFKVMVWVCVSEEFDVFRVTKAILEEVTSRTCDSTVLNSLQMKLKESLTGKKFLIVLDDVWCEKSADLNVLCLPFKCGAQGSKIIVTTRSEKVASNMRTSHSYTLQKLSDEACWQLFVTEASGVNGDFTTNDKLEEIGREIVKKCKGLPLALKTLGGLLRSSHDVEEWKRILESDIWDLGEDDSNILPALKLSYHYLPSQLKRCFAYCSIFPTDYEFAKEELILLWMAENFLASSNKIRRIEDVGDEYFNGLVSRSFFQRSSAQNSKFVMHDLVHDLAKYVSTGYCLLVEEADGRPGEVNMKKARHAGYMATDLNHSSRFTNILQALNLRTFVSHPGGDNYRLISTRTFDDLLLKLRCFRVLSLSGYENVNHLPESIGELSHLRYLDLSYTSICFLPESVSLLHNLQTLKLYSCFNLTKLPKDMHRLIKLRHLDLRRCNNLTVIPTQVSKLTNLQMLSIFIVGIDGGTKIGELKGLSQLRGEISIQKLENVGNVKDSWEQARMMDKENLETLKLKWSDDSNDDSQHANDVLAMLLPSKTLKELHIKGYPGKEFPNWIVSKSFYNIAAVQLSKCRSCLSLPPLGQLPALKSLDISHFDALVEVDKEFYGDGFGVKPFQTLEILKFSDMLSWRTWFHGKSEGFPKLIKLEIIDCSKLTGDLPCFLPSLKKFKIRGCGGLDFTLPRIPSILELWNQMNCCEIIQLHGLSSQISMPIGYLPSALKKLSIDEFGGFEFQFDSPHRSVEELKISKCCNALRSFPLDFFPMLKEVCITGLENLESLSMSDGHQLSSLSSLVIRGCPSFKLFPEKMHNLLNSLNQFEVYECPELDTLTESGLPYSLTSLVIAQCDKLVASMKNWDLKRLPNLREFEIVGSNEVVESFPEAGLLPMSITSLIITEFPCLDKNGLQQLTSLVYLIIWNLPKLQEIPREALPNSLQDLKIFNCKELLAISEECLPTSLEVLYISGCPKCQIKGLPASLRRLTLREFPELQKMPQLVLLNSLQWLLISDCPKLNIEHFPRSLQWLLINNCPLLASKCKGEYWNNISHIPHIRIDDDEFIS